MKENEHQQLSVISKNKRHSETTNGTLTGSETTITTDSYNSRENEKTKFSKYRDYSTSLTISEENELKFPSPLPLEIVTLSFFFFLLKFLHTSMTKISETLNERYLLLELFDLWLIILK